MKFAGQIRERLQARTGISSQFLQDDTLRLAVEKRREILRAADVESYWKQLEHSEAEWANLIDEVVVNETWFLRDEKPFEYLSGHAQREWLGRPPVRRILSAPCATGEEPYSIAITLLEAGFPEDAFVVEALDISERALQIARGKTYRATSFRGGKLGQSQHFEKLPGGDYQLSKIFEPIVRFRHANLLDPLSFPEGAKYDAIFCRNLLIYLDDSARLQLIATLERLLNKSGLLFVGHADAGAIQGRRLKPCGPSCAFVFQDCEPSPKSLKSPQRDAVRLAPKPNLPMPQFKAVPGPVVKKPVSIVKEVVSNEATLKRATELADAGKLKEAASLCDEYLKTHKLCPKGTHLLAVLRLAAGDRDQAERLFNQVAYLDPRHIEALVHLKQLAEMRGDRNSAETWRRRIEHNQLLARP